MQHQGRLRFHIKHICVELPAFPSHCTYRHVDCSAQTGWKHVIKSAWKILWAYKSLRLLESCGQTSPRYVFKHWNVKDLSYSESKCSSIVVAIGLTPELVFSCWSFFTAFRQLTTHKQHSHFSLLSGKPPPVRSVCSDPQLYVQRIAVRGHKRSWIAGAQLAEPSYHLWCSGHKPFALALCATHLISKTGTTSPCPHHLIPPTKCQSTLSLNDTAYRQASTQEPVTGSTLKSLLPDGKSQSKGWSFHTTWRVEKEGVSSLTKSSSLLYILREERQPGTPQLTNAEHWLFRNKNQQPLQQLRAEDKVKGTRIDECKI